MRAFIGVPVDHHLALALVEQRNRAAQQLGAGVMQPVAARNLHMTLAFLGEIDDAQLRKLRQSMPTQRRLPPTFDQPLSHCKQFPGARDRVLVVEGPLLSATNTLKSRVDNWVAGAGIAPAARGLRPHISIAYLDAAPMTALAWPVSLYLQVSELVLFESCPGRRGNDYRRLGSVALISGA